MNDAGSWIVDVTDDTFETEVLSRSRSVPVVVDFWADWCGPCKTLAPLLEKLATEAAGRFVLAKVNVDQAPGLAMAFRVQGIPAVKAVRDGQLVDEFSGVLPESDIRAFLDRVAPGDAASPDDESTGADDVDDLLEPADDAEAEAKFREELGGDDASASANARVRLADLLVQQSRLDEAADLLRDWPPPEEHSDETAKILARIGIQVAGAATPDEASLRAKLDESPDDRDTRYTLGCRLAADGRYEDALAELLAAAESDKAFARDTVRQVMVDIFRVLGVRHPVSDDYRSRLTSLLY